MSDVRHRALNARVPLWPDEPAFALAKRLARRNGVNSLASFGGDHRIPYREIIRGMRNAEIAGLADAEIAMLDAATFTIEGERAHLNGEILHGDDWSYSGLRVCPSCLRSDLERDDARTDYLPHTRSWWNLVILSVCPIHREVLIDRHPACPDVKVDHRALDVRFATGGKGDFTTLSPDPVEDVRAESYVLGRLGFMPKVSNAVFDSLPLLNAVRLMDRVGAVAAAGIRGYTSFGGNVGARTALEAGFAVFADGREGLFAFLDRLVESADIARGKWGPRVVYGRIYEWLSHDTCDEAYDPVRELVREHALDNLPLAADDLVFGTPVGERRIYTLWHASRAFGIVPVTARRVLRALGHLDDAELEKPNWQIALKAPVVGEVSSAIADRLSFNEARDYLALPRAPMNALYATGLLKPFLDLSSGVKEILFRKRDLDSFVATLLGDAAPAKNTDGLCDIVMAGKRAQTSTVEVVSALLMGRLKCAGMLASASGIMRVLVRLEEVKALRDLNADLDDDRTVEAGRRKLGVTWPVFGKLIELGYITVTSVGIGLRNRTRSLINEGSLEAFSAAYVSGTEIAALRKTHVRTLVPQLRLTGIEPAIGKNEAGQYFYRRADLNLLSRTRSGR